MATAYPGEAFAKEIIFVIFSKPNFHSIGKSKSNVILFIYFNRKKLEKSNLNMVDK